MYRNFTLALLVGAACCYGLHFGCLLFYFLQECIINIVMIIENVCVCHTFWLVFALVGNIGKSNQIMKDIIGTV